VIALEKPTPSPPEAMKRWCRFGTPFHPGRPEMTTPSRLHRHMARMVALEASIEKALDQLSK